MLEGVEFLIECEELVAGFPFGCFVFDKELKRTVHTGFLTCVDQRHAGECVRKNGTSVHQVAETFHFSTFPRVEVVVGNHVHQVAVFGIVGSLVGKKRVDIDSSLHGECAHRLAFFLEGVLTYGSSDFAEEVFHRPVVTHIESVLLKFGLACFGEHEEFGLHRVEHRTSFVPEVGGNFAGNVATITINADFGQPELESIDHSGTHFFV